MNYEGKSVFDLSGGGGTVVVDPQVEKNKNAIEQIGQMFFLGAFPVDANLSSTGQTLLSDLLGRFYTNGYLPNPGDFTIHNHFTPEFLPLSEIFGTAYGMTWNRPAALLTDSAVFDITVRASFFSRPDAPIVVGLNITRKNGLTVVGSKQYKVRVYPPQVTSIVFQYTLNLVEQVDLTGIDNLEIYTWGGLDALMQLPITFVSATVDENQIKVFRLK